MINILFVAQPWRLTHVSLEEIRAEALRSDGHRCVAVLAAAFRMVFAMSMEIFHTLFGLRDVDMAEEDLLVDQLNKDACAARAFTGLAA